MVTEENPWSVVNLESFLYYCCPECENRNQSKDEFLKHALGQHPNSKVYLQEFIVKEEEISEYNENLHYYIKQEEEEFHEVNENIEREELNQNEEIPEDNENLRYFIKQEEEEFHKVDENIVKDELNQNELSQNIPTENDIFAQENNPMMKIYKCVFCQDKFTDHSKFVLHIQNFHYTCQLCGTALKDQNAVVKHVKTFHNKINNSYENT